VLPYAEDLWLDEEDRPDPSAYRDPGPPVAGDTLRVAVLRLPRASNLTDLDPLAAEPGVSIRFVSRPREIADADLVVVPGTRATVDDLDWLRGRGIDRALVAHADAKRPIVGICGGYQMLGESIDDHVESRRGTVDGLGLLPVQTAFGTEKVLARPSRMLADGAVVQGYEIRHGTVHRLGGKPFFADEGCRAGSVSGTSWHGLFENDAFRRSFLAEVALLANRDYAAAPDCRFDELREARFERLADMVAEYVDTDALMAVVGGRTVEHAPLHLVDMSKDVKTAGLGGSRGSKPSANR
jgi:adenosylcobyric acid synthase